MLLLVAVSLDVLLALLAAAGNERPYVLLPFAGALLHLELLLARLLLAITWNENKSTILLVLVHMKELNVLIGLHLLAHLILYSTTPAVRRKTGWGRRIT